MTAMSSWLCTVSLAGWMISPAFGGSIEGRITNSVTGEPVVNATVHFIDSHSHPFTAATDSSGAYRLTDLADGDYRGEFSQNGFSDLRTGSSLESLATGSGYAHVSGDLPARVDVQLQPWGSVHGRVVDEDGNPAAGVTVEIGRSVDNSALTDANGAFAFTEVAPGSYTVVAKPLAAPRIRDGERVSAVPVYYPSATELAGAVPVPVHWGTDVSGIEIRLKSVAVHRISGVVLDPAGKAVSHAHVRLLGQEGPRQFGPPELMVGPRDPAPLRAPAGMTPQQVITFLMASISNRGSVAAPGPEPEAMKTETGDDGAFAFDAVQAGDWRVTAEVNEFGPNPMSGVVSAPVSEKDSGGLQIRLSAPFYIQVTADWGDDGVQKAHPAAPMVSLILLEGQPRDFFDPSGPPPDVFPLLPGRYRVTGAEARAPYYVASVTLGGAEVLGQVVDLEPGAGPIHVGFRHDGGSVKGTAEKGEGASVFLVSREAADLVRVRQTTCGAEGAFSFSNLPPGDYSVAVFDRVPRDEHGGSPLPAADLPASIGPWASSVRVEAGAEATVSVRVNPWPF